MSAKRSKVVKGSKGMTLTVYSYTTANGGSRWRFAWRDGKTWRYSTHKRKDDAENAAAERLEEIEGGGLVWSALPADRQEFLEKVQAAVPPGEEETVLAWLRSRGKSSGIVDAVGRFIEGKKSAAGELTPYLGTVKGALEEMSAHFAGRMVADLHHLELAEWWDARTAGRGWKLRRDIRAYLVMFWRWAQREGIAGTSPVTVAERLALVASEGMERRVLTTDELEDLLAAVDADYRAWVVLGAFAGLRPEEIAPAAAKRREKRGLRREEIDWRFSVLRLPACVSKVNRPRIVPMTAALKEGLAWAGIKAGQTGAVCAKNPSVNGETKRLGKLLFGGTWPKDVLRHSYGSYRNAIVRSLEQVAEEMGTSSTMLHRHYHNPQAEEEGTAWFEVRPQGDPIRSDGIEVNVMESENISSEKPRKTGESA
jgi:integrase